MYSKKRGDGLTRKSTANLTRTRRAELVNHSGVLLTEAAGVEEDGAVVPLQPLHTRKRLLGRGEDGKYNESSLRLGEHHFGVVKKREKRLSG